jgi:mevalonate kinase
MTQSFHANGKLLLTAEYFVLDGAWALALPVKLGQTLEFGIRNSEFGSSHREMRLVPLGNAARSFGEYGLPLGAMKDSEKLEWKSFDADGKCWFEATFDCGSLDEEKTSDPSVSGMLVKILKQARKMNPAFLKNTPTLSVRTRLEFPQNWGLGSSSTLIYNIAQWAQVNPFELQATTFGGSGYDVACAREQSPILFRLKDGKPEVRACAFTPPFAGSLYLIFLEKKQNSREGIARYREKAMDNNAQVEAISRLTLAFLESNNLPEFEALIVRHEQLVSKALNLPRAKDLYFQGYWGEIKSLGAWGGDFVLATSNRTSEETRRYFNEKGFGVFLPYEELAMNYA